jgi:hypothetical protein
MHGLDIQLRRALGSALAGVPQVMSAGTAATAWTWC